jgi:hypothetical protein
LNAGEETEWGSKSSSDLSHLLTDIYTDHVLFIKWDHFNFMCSSLLIGLSKACSDVQWLVIVLIACLLNCVLPFEMAWSCICVLPDCQLDFSGLFFLIRLSKQLDINKYCFFAHDGICTGYKISPAGLFLDFHSVEV